MVLDFVTKNLSNKSREYILGRLFIGKHFTNKLLAENPQLENEEKQLMIGQLNDEEKELFVIIKSLRKRMAGTQQRAIDAGHITIHSSSFAVEEARNKYREERERLDELSDDHEKAFLYFISLIKERLKKEIDYTLEKNPNILKKMYDYSSEYSSGFAFNFFDQGEIILKNQYPACGD